MITVDNEREIVANEVSSFIRLSIEKSALIEDLNLETPQLIIKNRGDFFRP
jgi:hypothetical protein